MIRLVGVLPAVKNPGCETDFGDEHCQNRSEFPKGSIHSLELWQAFLTISSSLGALSNGRTSLPLDRKILSGRLSSN